jgi:hypothetical protein
VRNLECVSGTFGGSGAMTVSNTMNWSSSYLTGSGRTIIAAGATLTITNAGNLTLARTLENAGTTVLTGGPRLFLSTMITNRPGALFEIQNAQEFVFNGGAPRFDNAGTFRKSSNTGTTTIGVQFNNYGMVDIRIGALAVNGGFTSSSSALLNCALGGTTAGTGYGQLQKSGTITLNGSLSVDLLPGFLPATNNTFTVVTAGTRSGTFASFSYPDNRVSMQLTNTTTSVVLTVTNVLPVPQPVLLMPVLSGSNALLTWIATSNITYRLEQKPHLDSTNWTTIPGDVTTTSNTASKLDALTTSNRFYRVHVVP